MWYRELAREVTGDDVMVASPFISLGQVTALKITVALDPTNHYLDDVPPHTILYPLWVRRRKCILRYFKED
jgi:hypothetical protein